MDIQFSNSSLKDAQKSLKIALLVCGCLSVSNLAALIGYLCKAEHFILIPQESPSKRVGLSTAGFSNQYITEWADSLTRSLLTNNPDTIEKRQKEFLNLSTSSSYGTLAHQFKEEARRLKKGGLSTAFYPKEFEINHEARTVRVTGLLHTYFGKDKAPVVETKVWEIGWQRGAGGVILVNRFEGDHHE